jgi:hypothetical protein
MKNLISIITPVIDQIEESSIKTQLLSYFPLHTKQFSKIENSFQSLTSRPRDTEILRSFFQSWSQTNNSAVTVAGLSNRMTMIIHKNQKIASEKDLFRAVASLNRIVDEDLAVVGNVLHSKLFYTMATNVVGDDLWLSQNYLDNKAIEFKKWKDKNSLRNKDIMIGLLTTLVHEIYTHGEVEFIIPLFENWLKEETDFTALEMKKSLAWIRVHCGPTEKDHFFHAIDAVNSFSKANDVDITAYDLSEIISDYLHYKSEVMESLNKQLLAVNVLEAIN